MIYVEILAGGKGTRMGSTKVPKQFLNLGNKPILIHTIEKFLLFDEVDELLVVVPQAWMNYTKDIVKKYIKNRSRIVFVIAGDSRTDTMMNGINYISDTNGIKDEDIIITHDAVRPFVSYRIIKENIVFAQKHGATDTVIPAVDTIVTSVDGEIITDIPFRKHMFQGQTPQSFNISELLNAYNTLNKDQISSLTDAAKIMVLTNYPVKLVLGEENNMKITTQYDLLLANAILKGATKNDQQGI